MLHFRHRNLTDIETMTHGHRARSTVFFSFFFHSSSVECAVVVRLVSQDSVELSRSIDGTFFVFVMRSSSAAASFRIATLSTAAGSGWRQK